jgi:hypothetical protein
MRSPAIRRRAFVVLGLLTLAGATRVTAEDAALRLNLRKTYLKTQGAATTIPALWVDAFSPTIVNCPDETGSCVIRIEVSSLFEQIDAGSVAMMRARVDGLTTLPTTQVEVDSTSSGTLSNSRTFTWMKTGVANGNHTVDVEFGMSGLGAAAIAGPRTLTIEVYKLPIIIGPF